MRVCFGQVVADGPAWECARIEGQFGVAAMGEAPRHEAKIQGALSLMAELDQVPQCRCDNTYDPYIE